VLVHPSPRKDKYRRMLATVTAAGRNTNCAMVAARRAVFRYSPISCNTNRPPMRRAILPAVATISRRSSVSARHGPSCPCTSAQRAADSSWMMRLQAG
jgi:hypothetical protein